jgi:phage terminase small subunit
MAAIRRCNWPAKNADVAANQILRKPHVAEAIAALVAERSGATQSRVIEELGKIAFADVHDISFVKDGQLVVRNTDELTADQRAIVSGYETNERGYVTVKLHDKVRALDLLAKILGMRRSPTSDAPAVAVQVNVNSVNDAGNRVMQRIDAMLQRQHQAALPAPSEQPIAIEFTPIKDKEAA